MDTEQKKDQLRIKLSNLINTGDFEEADEFLTQLAESISAEAAVTLFGDQAKDALQAAEAKRIALQAELAKVDAEIVKASEVTEVIGVKK